MDKIENSDITALIFRGNFKKAIQEIQQLFNNNQLEKDRFLQDIVIDKGNFEEGLHSVNELLEVNKLTLTLKYLLLLQKSQILGFHYLKFYLIISLKPAIKHIFLN